MENKKITGDEPANAVGAWGQQTETGITIRQYLIAHSNITFTDAYNALMGQGIRTYRPEEIMEKMVEMKMDIATSMIQNLNEFDENISKPTLTEHNTIAFLKWVVDNKYCYDADKKKYVAAWDNYAEYTEWELYHKWKGENAINKTI